MSAYGFTESERLRASFAGRAQRMLDAERRAELIVGAGFLAAALALAALGGRDRPLSLPIAALYVLAVAAIGEVRFDIGAGFTVPTQALFVPMLFALPVSLVPLLVALSLALGMAPSIVAGRVPLSRILAVPGNSWFAVGPSLVLALTDDLRPDAHWGVLALALGAQLACDFSANAVRERLCGGLSVKDLVGEVRQVYLIDLALAPLGLAVAIAAIGRAWAVLLIVPLFGVLSWFSKERRARLEQLIELNDAYRGTALLLGDVVEADDTYTGAHCKDVVRLALDVARELRLDVDGQRTVEFGALLHDIGKIAVPKEIVNKPGKLDPHEWEIIKTHTVEGQRMLERVGGFMGNVGQIVRCHHERWDGGGYPDGLRGAEIPLEARIISCCDAFNAMTTDRPYRKAASRGDALAELAAHTGTQFDPRVVDALTSVVSHLAIADASDRSAK
ncbi:MAG TPA: HD-GYP domain-containing protein [Solirubrobacteraceae bacterium]|jgi:putative nucleotidyltransferase with HDIG domain|nr:HD-GYP domain-containing protein [Solirubrobacteraceae bacterium]